MTNLAIFLLIPKDSVVKGFLPDGETDLFGDPSFHRSDHRLDRCMCGINPFVVYGRVVIFPIREDEYDHVYMIRHNAIPIKDNVVVMLRDLPDCRIDNQSILR